MECPKCQFENREGAKFCNECGQKFEINCPKCGATNRFGSKFCDECGQDLGEKQKPEEPLPPHEGERKYVTVLFSDLSGYTAMSEKLDPEEVKEFMTRIFGEIAQVVTKYEGFIEKFVGDAVMALFGVPKAHEDDPVRAILAAREIHKLIEAMSPGVAKKIGRSISMHTGINTGLVVTGEVNMEKGTHGVAGDTINLASRLQGLAKEGEILVGLDTYRQAEGHFSFESMEPSTVKGKSDPVQVYKVLSQKEKRVTTHRLSGLRANLTGRKGEMAELCDAVERVRDGKGKIFSICGDAGTGKSRLVEDFKATLNLEEIQWFESHAYPYAQNISYFPLVDFLNGVLHIDERDSSEKIREKIESGIKDITGNSREMVPYVGTLYSITYPEQEDVSAELWKHRLEEAVKSILIALAKKAPTVFFLEDLHWADRNFVELLRRALLEIRQPAIVLCAYRPPFSLFTSHQLNSVSKLYHEIRLQDLSLSDVQDMLASLLRTEIIPSELKRWVQERTEGNPFYLEELVNNLIESEALIRENEHWKMTRPIEKTDISSSIHGLISGRLDRLENETKRILQEASVIGRAFLYEILIKVSELEDRIDRGLSTLERLDLIRTRSFEPDLEYMFKHPLTQEVVYNGLLKKDRREIHEQIALVMESLFQDRLSEFYETLAFHFARGKSVNKAIQYLIKAGEKSLSRYAVEEAHEYYKKAYNMLAPKENKTKEEEILLIDMLNSWGNVYYYLGTYQEFVDLFQSNQGLAETQGDKARAGMFHVWFGVAQCMAGYVKDSYERLLKALKLGEETADQKVIGYACTWLPWVCSDIGLLDEGIEYGERAQGIAALYPSDQYLYYKSLGGITISYFCKGETKKIFEGAARLLEYGEKTSNSRSKCMGHWMNAFGYIVTGDLVSAEKSCKNAANAARDPAYPHFAKSTLPMIYFFKGQFDEAEAFSRSELDYCEKRGFGYMSEIVRATLSSVLIVKGHMQDGLTMFNKMRQSLIENNRRSWIAQSEANLGVIYSQIARGPAPGLSVMAKNLGFIVKNVPFASKKAEEHFNRAIDILEEIGAKFYLGQTYMGLGLLHKAKKRKGRARECLSKAVYIFQECEAHLFLKQAKEELISVE